MTTLEILDGLERQAAERAGSLALEETSGRRLTFGELRSRIQAVTIGLVAEGMRPGDRVLFTVPPGIDSIILILAIVRAGGVVVAANPSMGAEVFASRVHLMEPSWVMATSLIYWMGRPPVERLLRGRLGGRIPGCPDLTAVPARHFVRVGPPLLGGPPMIGMPALLRARGRIALDRTRRANGPVLVVFTSGTTAAPRAVVHTNGSIGAAIEMMLGGEHFRAGDVLYSDHLHLVLPALLAGVPAIIPRGHFHTGRVLGDLDRYRVTHTFGLPSEYLELVAYSTRRKMMLPRSLRVLLLGSAPVERTFLERLRSVVQQSTRVSCVYGMTEIIPVSTVDLDEKLAFRAEGDLLGKPVSGVRLRVAADGELLVTGPNLCQGYWGEPPITEVATGDFGRIDDHGRIILLGRKKAMIIRGHENIYPELLESTIDGIAGVRRCCVVGLYQDARADELVVLCVEPEPGTDSAALRARLEGSLREGEHRIDLAALPDRILLMPIPLAARSRKVDRSAVRVAAAERLAC
jgi:acyl-CoA synthetase (AMP-forming)/AMP-acid ligase II